MKKKNNVFEFIIFFIVLTSQKVINVCSTSFNRKLSKVLPPSFNRPA
jgi:hypothetical protein